jgi:hypothetical protein
MSSGPSKVIVLDPDPRAGRQAQLGFEREGIPVVVPPVAAGSAALTLAIAEEPGLVLVGGADAATGLDLVRRARAWLGTRTADVPIVFTGHGASRPESEAAGADEVIARPVFLRDIVTIARVLRGVSPGKRDHLTGNLADTSGVLTLVRAFSALGRSAVLTLIRGLRRGEVRFFQGEVTSAQVGLIHGQAALHQLLLWTDARFDYAHEDIVRRQQIPLSAEELFADAERFLEGVREHAGSLSPATVLEQDVARVHTLGKQIPTEVYGVLRMFDGHRVLADILEDSPYRVFETLRVAQKAVDVGLLRPVSAQRPKATWRAVLAIEEWLVGSETREAVVERTQGLDSGPVKATPSRKKRRGKRRSKRIKPQPTPSERKTGDIDWGALVPRVIGAEVGPLSGVVPAHEAHGEVELPTRDKPREGLEALMDTQKRQRIFPTEIGLEPSIVVADEPSIVVEAPITTPATKAPSTTLAVEPPSVPAAVEARDTAPAGEDPSESTAEEAAASASDPSRHAAAAAVPAGSGEQAPPRRRKRAERGDDLGLDDAIVDTSRDRRNTARHTAPPPPSGSDAAATPDSVSPARTTDRHAAPPPATPAEVNAAHAAARPVSDTARHPAPLRPPAIPAPRISDATVDTAPSGTPASASASAEESSSAPASSTAVPSATPASSPAGPSATPASSTAVVSAALASSTAVPSAVPASSTAVPSAVPASSTAVASDSAVPAAPIPSNGSQPTRAPSSARASSRPRASSPSVEVDPEMASLVAVPAYVEPMKSDPVAAVTAVTAEAIAPRTVRRPPGATDASALVRALVDEAIPPSDAPSDAPSDRPPSNRPPGDAPASGPVPHAAREMSDAVTAPVRPRIDDASIDDAVTAPVAKPASAANTLTTAFERVEPAPSAAALIAEPISVAGASATDVAVADVVTVSGSIDTAVVAATPRVTISEQPAIPPVASAKPAPAAASSDARPAAASSDARPAAVSTDTHPAIASSDAHPAAVTSGARPAAASSDDAAPVETDDEPSDGVVRAAIASKAQTARISRPRMRPSAPEHDGPPVKATSGEVSQRAKRPTKEPDISEPSILVADLAAAHDAVAAAVNTPAPAAPPADAASPSRELAVSDVRRDAVAFSETEEAFFRGAERTAPAPKLETFDDLDEGYEPPKFWDRVFGRKKRR